MVLIDPGNNAKIFVSKNKLKAFLYVIMRDVLPAGVVYEHANMVSNIQVDTRFSDDLLAQYAEQLILRFFLNLDLEVNEDPAEETEEAAGVPKPN